ncbi:MAG: T9SS type A sorting domain-containing protein [Bacteroidota bacterium]
MRKNLFCSLKTNFLLLIFLSLFLKNNLNAQAPGNACASAVSITLPSTAGSSVATGVVTTCGKVDNYTAGSYCTSTLYGGGEDGVYTITVPAGGGSYTFSNIGGTANWLIFSIHTACPPTTGNCVGGFTTGSGTTGNVTLTLAAGTYYLFIDTWPTPTCGTFNLQITLNGSTYNPCASIPTINCGVSTSLNIASGSGAYAPPATSCGFNTPGKEYLYSFTPTVTGAYSINQTASFDFIDYFFKPASGGCNGTGWTCIDDMLGAGTSVSFNLTAGTTYYLLLDPESTGGGNVTFSINCASAPVNPCASITPINCGVATALTIPSGNGIYNPPSTSCGFNTPGIETIYSYTPSATGTFSITQNSSFGYVDYFFAPASGGCVSTGWTCIDDLTGASTSAGFNLTGGVAYYIMLDPESTTGGAVNFTLDCATPVHNPCATIPNISCGTTVNQTVGSGNGAYNPITTSCGFNTPGKEYIYSFTATTTGNHFINQASSFGFIDYFFKPSSGGCNGTGWTCIDDVTGASTSAGFFLTAGTTYYILMDPDTNTGGSVSFSVGCPLSCPSGLGAGVVNVASLPYSVNAATTCGGVDNITSGNLVNYCGSTLYYGGEDNVYVFTPSSTGQITITQSGTSGTVGMMLYDGCPFSANCVGFAQDGNSTKSFCANVTAGVTYYLIIDSWPAPTCYTYNLSISAPASTPLGSSCTLNPHVINSIPFSANGLTTCCKGNDYNSTNACGSLYMNGEDYVFSYTPTSNITVDITVSNADPSSGLFLVDGCPNTGTCVGSATGASSLDLCGLTLNAGTTYYIIVDTWPNPNCTPFDIFISSSSAAASCNLSYNVSAIAFSNADSYTAGTPLNFPDDQFSPSYVPIGFDFCFDGYQYNQCLVSSNTYLIFDKYGCQNNLPAGNASPGGYSEFSISAAIPNTTDAPRNAILGPWQDTDPSLSASTDIYYQTLGTAPNRRLVVSFNNIPYYSCTSQTFKGQIKLFETSNNIEVHLANKIVCTTWNDGQAILGLHNLAGNLAVVPAGYNAPTQWTATNNAWRFSPNCANCINLLPLELLDIYGEYTEEGNKINWKIATPQSNTFSIDKSLDGFEFSSIGTLTPGNNQTIFSFTDTESGEEGAYYKISTFTSSQQILSSKIIYIGPDKSFETGFVLRPNPSNGDNTMIEFNPKQSGTYEIQIRNMLGLTLYNENYELKKKTNFNLNIGEKIILEKGVYLVEVIFNGKKESKKLIIN